MSVNIAMSNYNAQMAYSKMSSFVSSFSRPISSESTTYKGITDSLKLSPQSLHAFSRNWIKQQISCVTAKNDDGDFKTTDTISKEYAEKLAGFAENFKNIISSRKIAINEQITLQSDGLGHVKIVGGIDESSDNLDEVLKEYPSITNDFMLVAARESIINETKENPRFFQDYTDNPQNTLEKHEVVLRDYMLRFQLNLSKGKISTGLGKPVYP